jgi:hypothetical protein
MKSTWSLDVVNNIVTEFTSALNGRVVIFPAQDTP